MIFLYKLSLVDAFGTAFIVPFNCIYFVILCIFKCMYTEPLSHNRQKHLRITIKKAVIL